MFWSYLYRATLVCEMHTTTVSQGKTKEDGPTDTDSQGQQVPSNQNRTHTIGTRSAAQQNGRSNGPASPDWCSLRTGYQLVQAPMLVVCVTVPAANEASNHARMRT